MTQGSLRDGSDWATYVALMQVVLWDPVTEQMLVMMQRKYTKVQIVLTLRVLQNQDFPGENEHWVAVGWR